MKIVGGAKVKRAALRKGLTSRSRSRRRPGGRAAREGHQARRTSTANAAGPGVVAIKLTKFKGRAKTLTLVVAMADGNATRKLTVR